MAYNVLVIEDDVQINEIISDMIPSLSDGEINIISAYNGNDGIDLFFDNQNRILNCYHLLSLAQ